MRDSGAVEEPEKHAHAHEKREKPGRSRRDLLAAVASGFVGALALATSTYNVYLQRQQVSASVLPHLVLGPDFSDDGFSLNVANRGVGPAEVRRVRVTVDGKPARDWVDAVGKLLGREDISFPAISTLEGEEMSPGLEIAPIKVRNMDDSREIIAQRRRLAVEICYCSTLGDCWVLNTKTPFEPSTTQPVNDCVPDAKPFQSVQPATMDTLMDALGRKAARSADGGRGDGGQAR